MSAWGLALSGSQFWSLTPCEFNALKRPYLEHTRGLHRMYAGIQATLCNAHFRNKSHPEAFTESDFITITDDKPKRKETWQEQKFKMEQIFYRGVSPQQMQKIQERVNAASNN